MIVDLNIYDVSLSLYLSHADVLTILFVISLLIRFFCADTPRFFLESVDTVIINSN